jgi:hypothetical protein
MKEEVMCSILEKAERHIRSAVKIRNMRVEMSASQM